MKIKYLNIFLIFLLSLSIIGNVNAANSNINSDNNLLYEMAKWYHDEMGDIGVVLKLDANKLRYGDYIQLRNYDYVFMYSHEDNEGYIYFNTYYGESRCKQNAFNRLYTGYALLLNY